MLPSRVGGAGGSGDRADAPPPRRPGAGHRAGVVSRSRGAPSVFHDELDQVARGYAALRRRPPRARSVVGYAGLMFVVDEAHVTNIAVHPDHRRERRRHPAAGRAGDGRHRPRLRGVDAGGAGQQHGRPGAVPHVRVRAGRRAAEYYENTEDAIVMWCHDIQTAAYARPAGASCPGRRVDRGAGRRRCRSSDPTRSILGIETSCDETAAALVMGGGDVLSSVVSSQIDLHATFGGVVPEIASRAHLELLNPVDRPGDRRGRRRRPADRRRGLPRSAPA